jgi:hypothetical protein
MIPPTMHSSHENSVISVDNLFHLIGVCERSEDLLPENMNYCISEVVVQMQIMFSGTNLMK